MRTMLISLILICSLAQLASASAQPELINSGDCETLYTCFAPHKCKSTTPVTIANSEIVEVKRLDTIWNDCDAIIRFHRYDTRKTHIFIESFQDTSKVNKIEFTQERLNTISGKMDQLNKFSCEIDATDGKMKGKSFDDVKYQTDIADKLRCKFEILKDQPHKEKYIYNDNVLFKIFAKNDQQGVTTKDEKYKFDIEVNCDPTNFEFEEPKNELTKLYKKVSDRFKPEEYICDGEEFKMEYKKKKEGEKEYELAKKVKCKGDSFEVWDEQATKDSDVKIDSKFGPSDGLEIRCVAEAKFFCKYSPKVKDGEEGPKLEVKPEGNSLKCPPGKPHFVIVGEIDEYYPDKNPVFKCMAFGETALWTINFEEVYTEDGLTVYCTDKLKCSKPISANAVVDGTLGSDTFPKCFKQGTLKTTDGKIATNFKCDDSIGEFKYTADGSEKTINDTTTFICEYPKPEPPKTFDAATVNKFQTGLYIAIGVSISVAIVTCAVSAICMKRKMKRKKKEYLAEQLRNIQYMTKEEKALLAQKAQKNEALLKKKNPHQKSGEKSKPVEKDEKDEKMKEQKRPVKTSQHQSMTKLGVTVNAKDKLPDDKSGSMTDGIKKYAKLPRLKGTHGLPKTALFKRFNANKEPIVAKGKDMDVKRKKGKMPADNES